MLIDVLDTDGGDAWLLCSAGGIPIGGVVAADLRVGDDGYGIVSLVTASHRCAASSDLVRLHDGSVDDELCCSVVICDVCTPP